MEWHLRQNAKSSERWRQSSSEPNYQTVKKRILPEINSNYKTLHTLGLIELFESLPDKSSE
jgi:hypothetical protein